MNSDLNDSHTKNPSSCNPAAYYKGSTKSKFNSLNSFEKSAIIY